MRTGPYAYQHADGELERDLVTLLKKLGKIDSYERTRVTQWHKLLLKIDDFIQDYLRRDGGRSLFNIFSLLRGRGVVLYSNCLFFFCRSGQSLSDSFVVNAVML